MAITRISNMTKKMNHYALEVHGYDDTPKAVFAALAFSLAMRLSDDDFHEARKLLLREWNILGRNGIVSTPMPAYLRGWIE